jgi:hypothetical protein
MTHTIRPLVLVAWTTLLACPAAARPAPDTVEQTEALHREITALRIVHALDLGTEQIAELTPLVEQGISLVDDLQQLHERAQKDNLEVLRRVRDDLADDGELTEKTEDAAEQALEESEKTTRVTMLELHDLAQDVMDVLDEQQRQKVHQALITPPGHRREFRPGDVTPPEDLTGPDTMLQQDQLPLDLQREIQQRNARRLFGLVFSQEFLDVLTDR